MAGHIRGDQRTLRSLVGTTLRSVIAAPPRRVACERTASMTTATLATAALAKKGTAALFVSARELEPTIAWRRRRCEMEIQRTTPIATVAPTPTLLHYAT